MQESDELKREIESLRTRLLRMNEVSRRITESLHLETVLQEVIDCARSLTGARYGALTVFDDSDDVQDLITSGIASAERRKMGPMPKGVGLIGFLNEVQAPLRLADLSKHPRSVGLPDFLPPMKTFLGSPIRHSGEPVGNIYLTEKEGGQEFTKEDEEAIAMFASMAATAIANASKYEDELRAKSDAEDELERLETLVRTSPVGVVAVDARDRKVVSANQEAQRIIGLHPKPGTGLEEYQKSVVCRRMDGQIYEIHERPLSRALDRGETVIAEEMTFDRPDGRKVTALVNATPIYSENGESVSAVATIQDMTPLEEMQSLRNDFLSMVSHELRTPLTVIKGSSTTALNSSTPHDPAEMREFFKLIDQQADRLNKMVSNLADTTRIEASEMMVSPVRTELKYLVDDAISAFLRCGTAHRVQADIRPDLPAVTADPRCVTRALHILLANASRFSTEPSVIGVTASHLDLHVEVSISCAGDGLTADQMTRTFSKRRSLLPGRNGGGNNVMEDLGLAICKGIVEAHGGRIWAESDAGGKGTRFSFTIPAAADMAVGAAQSSTPVVKAPKAGEETRILSLDDDPQLLRHIRSTLTNTGYVATVTETPHEMLRLLQTEQPHLVLLDLVLPETNGFDLLEPIREISDAPVIFLSASGREEDIVRALEQGADDYIVKPFSPNELVARIESALRKQRVSKGPGERKPFRLAGVTIDYDARQVTVSGRPVQLTPTEYGLLFELSVNAGRALTHDQILQRVWGTNYTGEGRLLRVFIGNLRRKLGDDAKNPKYIFTEPGVGYRMAKP